MRFLASIALFFLIATAVHAAPNYTPTTQEAQAIIDAVGQTNNQYWSYALLAMAQLVAAVATLCLLINLRTLCFVFLFCYGLLIVNVPYYVPNKFKIVFGFAIIVMSIAGILWRLMGLRKPSAVASSAK